MKNLFALIGTLLFISTGSLLAQGPDFENKRKEGKELRKKHYEQSLQLTEAESNVFWPIFEKHEESLRTFKNKNKKPRLELMSDAEAESYIDNYFDHELELIKIKKQLFVDLKGKLPARKIAMIPSVEKNFRRELLNRYKRANRPEGLMNRFPK